MWENHAALYWQYFVWQHRTKEVEVFQPSSRRWPFWFLFGISWQEHHLEYIREGWLHRIGRIFGKVPKEGSHFQSKKIMLQILGTLNRAFWAWNQYKRVISYYLALVHPCIYSSFSKNEGRVVRLDFFLQKLIWFGAAILPLATKYQNID